MQQLSLVDSLFVNLEDNRMPMHIGGLYVMAPEDPSQKLDFGAFRQFFLERLHLSAVFRRRLVEMPLKLGLPYWVNDADFHLDNHLFHIALPEGGTRADLLKLAAQIYNTPLDRSRPLWSITIISGVDHLETIPTNGYLMVSKVHHANIDGVSGAEIMAAIFDISPKPRHVAPPTEPWVPEEVSSIPKLIMKDYAKRMMQFPGKMMDLVTSATGSISAILNSGIAPKELFDQFKTFNAPRTLLNQSVTSNKVFGFMELPISRIKAVKDDAGVKVNDVILSMCAAGLRRYLMEKGELPEKSLVAAAPVSVRAEAEQGTAGNKVTMMGVDIGTNISESLARVQHIHAHTKSSKVIARATPVDSIAEVIPAEVAAAAAQIYTRMGFLSKYVLLYNVVITNVPGPPIPLYINGFKVLHHYGLGITMENLGLMITVFSMAGNITITLTACQDILPDVQVLADYIKEELTILEEELAMSAP